MNLTFGRSASVSERQRFKYGPEFTCGIERCLLHLESRPEAWRQWFSALGVSAGDVPGMLVDQFAVATQAAVAGLGVALLPRFLIDSELARGDLVVAIDLPMESEDDYYLAWPLARENYPPLHAFRQWIGREAAA